MPLRYYTAKNDYDHTKAIQNPYEGGDETTETTGSAGQNEDHDARVASEHKENRAEDEKDIPVEWISI